MGQRRDICDRRRTYDELAATGRNFGRRFCNIKFYSGEFRCEKFYPVEFRSDKFCNEKFNRVELWRRILRVKFRSEENAEFRKLRELQRKF